MFGEFPLISQPRSMEVKTKPKRTPVEPTARTLRSRKKDVDYTSSECSQEAKVRGTNKDPPAILKEKKKETRRGKSKGQEELKPIVEPRTRRDQTKIAESIKNRVKLSDSDKENHSKTAKKQAPEVEFDASRGVVEVVKLTAKQVADLEQNRITALQRQIKTNTKSMSGKNLEEVQKGIESSHKVTRKVLHDRGSNRAIAKHDDSVAEQQTKSTKVSSVKIQESRVLIEQLPSANIKSLTSASKEETQNVTKPEKDIPIRRAKTIRAAAAKQNLEVAQSKPSKEISSIKVQTSRVLIERLPSVAAPKIAKSKIKENPKTPTLAPKPATPLKGFQNVTKRLNKRKAFPAVEDESPKRSTRGNKKDHEPVPQKKTFDEKVTLRRGGKDKKNIRKSPPRYVTEYNLSPTTVNSSVSPPKDIRGTTLPPSAVHSSPSSLLKVIEKPENLEDPYSFEMSQSEANDKKKIKKPKKQVQKSKPGNKIDILMMQKALDAMEYSCNVQNNPTSYVAQRENIEKQIKDPAPRAQQVIDVDAPRTSRMAAQLSKAATSLQKQINVSTPVQGFIKPNAPSTSRVALSKASTSHSAFSKVYHSPKAFVSPNYYVSPGASCSKPYEPPIYEAASQSPPIQSTYALKMISALRKGNVIQNTSSPFRVPGNLPTTFYMGLSGNDGAPTYSSDLLGERRTNSFGEDVNSQHKSTDEKAHNSARSESYKSPDNSKGKTSDELSALGDSNAENLEPVGMLKSPIKKVAQHFLRSPFKSLPLPALPDNEVSSLSILTTNSIVDQSIILKNKTVVNQEEGNESLDLLETCEKVSKAYSKESESRDAFGFDELLGNDHQASQQSSVSETTDTDSDIHQHLQKFKQYLPSNHNKNRDKNVFPTSMMNECFSAAFKEPSTSQSTVKGFFSSSTPIATAKKNTRNAFADISKIAETSEAIVVDDTNSSVNNTSIGELFEEDQTELYRVS